MTWEKVKLLSWLFKTDVLVSSFSFGGGYVVLPMIRRYFVEEKGLFGEDELMDMAAVAVFLLLVRLKFKAKEKGARSNA